MTALTVNLDLSKVDDMELSPDTFRKQIASAQSTLHQLLIVRRKIDERIGDLRGLIRANANFLPEMERAAELLVLECLRPPTTIAEAVKIVLWIARSKSERLTPIQIKERAEERGFDFSDYTNPMASIHTILKRMREADPPEVGYDEPLGTYTITRIPTDLSDPAFFSRVTKKVWLRLANSTGAEKTLQIAEEEIDKLMESITKRQNESAEE